MGMAERADQRFVWNRHLLSELQSSSALKSYCLPLIHGCKCMGHLSPEYVNLCKLIFEIVCRRQLFQSIR